MNPIPVQELRIGNIVMNVENGVSRVICCDMINLRQNYFPPDPEEYWIGERREQILLSLGYNEAIPLTEEWLVKLGFKKYNDSNCWKLPNNWYLFHNTEKDEILDVGFYWGELYTKIEAVHQLQNLYYAITKKELTYA